MKFRLNLPLGFHISFEDCDKCKNRCPNYQKNETENAVFNIRRKKLSEYLKQLQLPTHVYNSTPDMFEELGFNYCLISKDGYSYGLISDILMIDHTDDKKLIIATIDQDREVEWYKEFNKTGKIHTILSMRFNQ
jgi:hypothetical protein